MKSWPLLTILTAFVATTATAAELPPQGMSMTKVVKTYGQPQKKIAPVGKPPITRWQYPDFTVVFEYKHVVQSVRFVKDAPVTTVAPTPAQGQLLAPNEAAATVEVQK